MFLRKQPRDWNRPPDSVPVLCLDMLNQSHLLIAGASGSGKSVLVNSIIWTALHAPPWYNQFVLIDPKRVELVQWSPLPHTLRHATEPGEIVNVLIDTLNIIEDRYKRMQKNEQRKSPESNMYIIIDEFADLVTTNKKQVLPLVQRIAQIGRAANVHLILATQRPTKDIISGAVKVNFDAVLALRCRDKQDSRNILGTAGAETLPRYGFGYYQTPERIAPELVQIPYKTDEEIRRRVAWWTEQTKSKKEQKKIKTPG